MSANLFNNASKQGREISSIGTLTERADVTLVAAAKHGNRDAFEILVERHQRRILAVALRFTRIREDAEDVVQQSFQKAFVHLHKFEGASSFSTWLTRIAINEALMLLRRGRAVREVSIADPSGNEETAFGLEVLDLGPDPESSYSQREQERILSAAMKELRPGIRRAIELRDLGELTTQETAGAMGLSIGAVKARVFHGRRMLRKMLKRYAESAWISGKHAMQARRATKDVSSNQFAIGI
ncbi:MAG TPA: sigma-70 family RNA polymerase sigma factor [Candidatus Acidoferrum sp.]|nr:sigma-70 family RNA polymerase sigma factor [Candidatus Acidoferrum sp.]